MQLTTWLLLIVLAAWVGFSLWRFAGARLLLLMEASYRAHHLRVAQNPDEAPPAVQWDFEQQRLVEVPASEVSERAEEPAAPKRAIRKPASGFPLSAYGIILARIPALVFHGLFAAVALSLFLLQR